MNVRSIVAAQRRDMNAANVACFGDVGVDGIGCGGRLPLKIAMSKAATSKTPTVTPGKISIAQSKVGAEKYDTEMVD